MVVKGCCLRRGFLGRFRTVVECEMSGDECGAKKFSCRYGREMDFCAGSCVIIFGVEIDWVKLDAIFVVLY